MATGTDHHDDLTPRRRASVDEIREAIRFRCPELGEPEITVSGRLQISRCVSLRWNRRLTVEVRFEEETDLPLQRWVARSRAAGQTRAVWRGGWSVVPIDADPQLSVALDFLIEPSPPAWTLPLPATLLN